MFCRQCGEKHLESAAFCGKCGTKREEPPPQNDTPPPVPEPPPMSDVPEPPPMDYPPPNPPQEPKGKKPLILIICLLALLLVAGAAAWWLFLRDSEEKYIPTSEEEDVPYQEEEIEEPEEPIIEADTPDEQEEDDIAISLLSALQAYRAVLNQLIDGGRNPWTEESALAVFDRVYIELVDFDMDGIPELVVVITPEMQVAGGIGSLYVFRYAGWVELIYSGNLWGSAGWGFYALETASNGETYLVHIETLDFDLPYEIVHRVLWEDGFEIERHMTRATNQAAPYIDQGRSLWMWQVPSNLLGALAEIERKIAELESGEDAGAAEVSHAPGIDIAEIDAIISSRTNARDVAFAVLDIETGTVYATANGNIPFVAAGFYAPLFSLAISRDGNYCVTADTMMAGMDNAAANRLIADFGGFSQVNESLRALGYTQTSFARNFGDTEASRRGYENFTTAEEAALILADVYLYGGHFQMNVNLSGDGINMPDGVIIYAHRGHGIGEAFNVFVILLTPNGSFSLAVLTNNIGGANAAPVISAILENVREQAAANARS